MDDRLAARAEEHHGLLTCGAGATRSAVRWAQRRGDLVVVGPGAWCASPHWEALDARGRHLMRLRSAQRLRAEAVACAESAAVVLSLPLPGDPPAEPRLLSSRTGPRRGGDSSAGVVRGRRAWLAPDEVLRVDGILVTAPPRTVVDLARHLPFRWALAAADAARRLHGTTTEELVAAAGRNPRAPGHRAAAVVAALADPRAESALESVARAVMLQLGLPAPDLQAWVSGDGLRYRVDLLVAKHWTVVEADGKVKYRDEDGAAAGRVWRDKRRRDALHDWGYEVVRFTHSDQFVPALWGRRCVRSFERAHERRGLPTPDWTSLATWL